MVVKADGAVDLARSTFADLRRSPRHRQAFLAPTATPYGTSGDAFTGWLTRAGSGRRAATRADGQGMGGAHDGLVIRQKGCPAGSA
jgi:hypothetical protein